MEKLIQKKITKDFSNKILENVFVKKSKSSECSKINSVLSSAKETLCIVLENALSDQFAQDIKNISENVRIYILTKKIDTTRFERFKNRCIIRQSDFACGNYAIIDKNKIAFFNTDLNCIEIENKNTAEKLHELFIYNFWNNSTKEFIFDEKPVVEKTFDVAFPQENEYCSFDKTADEKSKPKILFENADFYWLKTSLADGLKKKENATFYLSEKCVKENIDALKNSPDSQKFYLSKNIIHSAFSCAGKNYISNFENDKNFANDGKCFAVEFDIDLPAAETYKFTKSITFEEAEKNVLLDEKLQSVKVEKELEEPTAIKHSFDKKNFRIIKKYSDEKLYEFLESKKELESSLLACNVVFNIELQLKQKTLNGKAGIYRDYENFNSEFKKAFDNKVKALTLQKEKLEKEVKEFNAKNEKSNEIISKNRKQIEKIENEIKGINENDKKGGEQIAKKRKEKKRLEEEKKSKSEENEKCTKEILEKQTQISKIEKEIRDLEKSKPTKNSKTVSDCKEIQDFCTTNNLKFNTSVPKHDIPKFGTLYEQKGKFEYEYEVPDENLDNAIAEMKAFGIENVSFV